jgi:hypothetical protein
MAVDLKIGTRIEPSPARRLFASHTATPSSREATRHQWSVTADGKRFLVRYANNSAAGFLGGRGGASPIPFNAPGALIVAQAGGGQGFVSSGLTVIRDWPAAAGKAGK